MTSCHLRGRALAFSLGASVAALSFASCSGSSSAPEGRQADRVERVVDGDTVALKRAGKVRLIGVDTPEKFGEVECWGPQASQWLKRRLKRGAKVSYLVGEEPRDKYDRLLIYLRDRRGSVNLQLVRSGQGKVLTIPPNDRRAKAFEKAQEQAVGTRVGLWGKCGGS